MPPGPRSPLLTLLSTLCSVRGLEVPQPGSSPRPSLDSTNSPETRRSHALLSFLPLIFLPACRLMASPRKGRSCSHTRVSPSLRLRLGSFFRIKPVVAGNSMFVRLAHPLCSWKKSAEAPLVGPSWKNLHRFRSSAQPIHTREPTATCCFSPVRWEKAARPSSP